MFVKSGGPHLSAAQAQALDDEYFGSNPFGYFSARISSILSAANSTDQGTEGELRANVLAALGLTDGHDPFSFEADDRELQVAIDSLAVRHHAAEALVRLYHGLAVAKLPEGWARCVWVSISDGPSSLSDLAKQADVKLKSAEGVGSFWTLVLPPDAASAEPSDELTTALNVMGSWLLYAIQLLRRDDVNSNVAHNKIKHGLCVRSRSDVRLTFTTQAPNADGTISASALTGDAAVDVFDCATLDYLVRPPKQDGRKQGLELSTLRVSSPTLLAETWMLAVTHAAMFSLAAERHFENRDAEGPAYPALPLGPTPTRLLGESVIGMRSPVTTPPDGGPPDRDTGFAFQGGFVSLEIDFEQKSSVDVVDD